ncbi:hypothetical protein SAMN02745883_00690 [Caminicella sporogenes DSM 14501]|uniref:Uncharacterized protein n=1 Tax=Caminicella sporogenes DSM 14501 TaxID=1121266 RepID=A0A1M6MXH1_9FIRM|nr:hypothetical protein [Caminicella sporogenes]RKD22456.1 hypothetical protein BET04_05335 [Caminicella sporogenes]SHJ88167.1 hypothetical protein SAMN02745883_00690 [Caminicella sporogenes DSM 14501]
MDNEEIKNLTELFEKLYPIAVENGVDAVFYWDMTYGEIITAIEGNQRKVKQDIQVQASLVYKLGDLLRFAFNEPNKYPTLQEAFPKLFDDEAIKPKQQDWRIMKERISAYAKKKAGRK